MKSIFIKITAKVIFCIALLMSLVSCATLSESECKSANWEIIGLEDGSKGRNTSHIGKHRKACAEYRVAPDLAAYLRGHSAGLREFCTEQNGFNQGIKGQKNDRVCPASLTAGFDRGYRKGIQIYQLQSEIRRLHSRIESHEHRLHDIEEMKIVLEEEIILNSTTERRRRELLKEIKELERETESLYHEIDEMRVVLVRLKDNYERRH